LAAKGKMAKELANIPAYRHFLCTFDISLAAMKAKTIEAILKKENFLAK
jgi:hypothetical protein